MKKTVSYIICITATLCIAACGKPGDNDGGNSDNGAAVEETRLQKKSAKRGVSFNFNSLPEIDLPLLGPVISWSYNWGMAVSDAANEGFKKYALDYCPMTWNDNWSVATLSSVAAKTSAEYLLAFNEPNLTDQANMTPEKAAGHWPAVLEAARANNLKIIAPAMNYGTLAGYNDPWKWLDEFFAQPGVSLDDVDGIAVHCYMGSAGAVMNYIDGFRKYGKPIWLTEFCNWVNKNVSADAQMKYMVETINALEAEDAVFRYAWFIPRGNGEAECHNSLLTSRKPFELTPLGKVFVNMSSWDENLWYSPSDVIPAEHYNSCSGALHLQPTTDKGGELELTDLKNGVSASWQVEIPSAGAYSLELRYSTYYESAVKVLVDGKETGELRFRNTERKWDDLVYEGLVLGQGRHTLTIEGASSFPVSLNYLIINK